MRKINEKGRSMVEMLGVLAIIGVLSAGALKGYSDAMFKFKVNKTVDIFQGVLQRTMELEEKGLGKNSIDHSNAVNYGFLSECQEQQVDGTWGCRLPIGTLVFDVWDYEGYIEGAFFIRLNDSKSCTAFISVGWEKVVPIEWFNPNGHLKIGGQMDYMWDNKTDMFASDYAEACETCNEGPCDFYVVIREY